MTASKAVCCDPQGAASTCKNSARNSLRTFSHELLRALFLERRSADSERALGGLSDVRPLPDGSEGKGAVVHGGSVKSAGLVEAVARGSGARVSRRTLLVSGQFGGRLDA